jgi:CheY-like chemotaxis protein
VPARILVIDDSPTTVELLVQGLASAGYQAAAATDLASLDAQLKTQSFDLVLVDVNMPEMYGDDVIEFLREQRKLTSKLVLYSEMSEEVLAQKAAAVRADGYLPKSRGLEATIAEIGRLVGPPAKAAPAPPEKRRKRVLIVDDSETTTMLLASELASKGFEVSTASDAEKATKIILKKQTRPDLVLLDVRMPNVNGEQFCRFIKGNSLFAGIKVLLCSAENVEELQRICREAGADGYVPKDAVLAKVLASELS